MFVITCTKCGKNHALNPGALLGAKTAVCICGEPLYQDGSFEERREEMKSSELFIEASCGLCNRTYKQYVSDLEHVLLSQHIHAYLSRCPQCGLDQVVIIETEPEVLGQQVTFVRYPPIELRDCDNLDPEAFMKKVIERVSLYLGLTEDVPQCPITFSSRIDDEYFWTIEAAERARISALPGGLPEQVFVREFFEKCPALSREGPWDIK